MKSRKENKERVMNSIVCSETLFHSFLMNPNKSYRECAQDYLESKGIKSSREDTEDFCRSVIYYSAISLLREILCLVQNGVKRGRVNLTKDVFVSEINRLKNKTIIEGDKTLSNYDFIKAIRNALAHNNELSDNPSVEFLDNGLIINSEYAGLKLKLSFRDLHDLCDTIFKSISSFEGLGVYAKRFENAIMGDYFDIEKINRYMKIHKDGESYDIEFDEHQKQAFLKFLNTGEVRDDGVYIPLIYRGKEKLIRLAYPWLLKQVFPSTSKPEDLAIHKTFLYRINVLLMNNMDATKDDIIDKANPDFEFSTVFTHYLLNSEYSMFLLKTNGIYTILADRELEDVEPEFVEALGKDNVRNIRNAMQHGTYFYNFDDGVEIYDGGKKLKHKTTLNLSKATYNMHKAVVSRLKEETEEEK